MFTFLRRNARNMAQNLKSVILSDTINWIEFTKCTIQRLTKSSVPEMLYSIRIHSCQLPNSTNSETILNTIWTQTMIQRWLAEQCRFKFVQFVWFETKQNTAIVRYLQNRTSKVPEKFCSRRTRTEQAILAFAFVRMLGKR